jgi:hypothetical protein
LGRAGERRGRSLILVAFAVGAALLGAAGCGASEGVAGGALVNVYASAPLSGSEAAAGKQFCGRAQAVLAQAGGEAGNVHLRLICLDDARGGRWSLAAVGANARRATEDSAAIAYLGEPQVEASRFSLPILETAGIGQVAGSSGGAAMAAVLRAVRGSGDAAELRDAVREALGQ